MPNLEIKGINLHYRDEGSGPETIVFSHGLLLNGSIFTNQIAHLKSRYRCIAFDHRGQGASELAQDGFDMDNLTDDTAQLIEALAAGPCHFVGHSMGGFVGLRLGIARPDLIKSLILINSSAAPETFAKIWEYRLLNVIARRFGLEIVADKIMPIMFGQTYLNDPARDEERSRWRALIVKNDRIAVTRAVKGAINRSCMREKLPAIDRPTLIIVGNEDVTTPPEKAEELHRGVNGSTLVRVPRAGHISTVEEPQAINLALDDFLQRL